MGPAEEGGLHPKGCNEVEDPATPGCGTPRRDQRAATPTPPNRCRRRQRHRDHAMSIGRRTCAGTRASRPSPGWDETWDQGSVPRSDIGRGLACGERRQLEPTFMKQLEAPEGIYGPCPLSWTCTVSILVVGAPMHSKPCRTMP